ncbi:hypothetical protein EDEG_00095 [Edhazardia aedis USNM 41457]|uniref:RCC1-like domain-containing protein n=1 Tax=Edhazardia aedis (strain USNM 41457) TaxID=1003232 RepID=J8ZZ67_EDHAE|nr:hypothetical protein EDEG_00095 [Edhazardia aedis USNM 41457]|eukprot:EJW04978.1 hypothetical protein EDEG_00095 [Edhazardia aedis USNM 41457]
MIILAKMLMVYDVKKSTILHDPSNIMSKNVYVFGSNLGSQLGNSDLGDSHKPILISELSNRNVQSIVAGSLHTIALVDKKIYTWGCNDEFALGREGDEDKILEVVLKVSKKKEVVGISAGASHSACLLENGNVYAWGTFRDTSGIIGFDYKTKYQKTPKLIQRNVVQIFSTDNVITMLLKTGGIVSYGADLWRDRFKIERRTRCFKNKPKMKTVLRAKSSQKKIVEISGGDHHVLGITSDGYVKAWGNNFCGQHGNDHKICCDAPNDIIKIKNIVKVKGGTTHSLFLDNKGNLYGCGENGYGQLSHNEKELLTPTLVATNVLDFATAGLITFVVKKDGVYSCGTNYYGELGHVEDGKDISFLKKIEYNFGKISGITCGGSHAIIVADDEGIITKKY